MFLREKFMGKKILKGLLIVMLLSGVTNASDENDTPNINKKEYITISNADLIEHKEQIDLLNQRSTKIEEKQIDQHEQTVQELQTLKQEFSYLKQQNVRLEQQNAEIKQQNIELKQQNLKLEQKMDQQNMQTNAFLEQLLKKFK